MPAGSLVRVKSRLRLYSERAALFLPPDFPVAARFATDFPDDVFFDADFLVADFFAADFFAADFFAAGRLAELFFADVFFATGRFTVRLRVVAMVAPWCEEHAEGREVRRSGGQEVDTPTSRPPQ
jgi:hypothetical protein